MMAVEIWFRESLDTQVVEGDLVALAHNLNVAGNNGKSFVILPGEAGDVMIQTRNINFAREKDATDALIGR